MKTSLSIPGKSVSASLMRVAMQLRNVLYITYPVPEARLRALLPEFLKPAAPEKDNALISIVVLRCTKVRINSLPFVRFNYNQLNIRTYVVDPITGKQGVYFLESGVTSRLISMATHTLGIPWQHIGLEVQVTTDNNRQHLSYNASGIWRDDFHIAAAEAPEPCDRLTLFKDIESAVDHIVRPLIGFFGAKSGHTGRFTIWHQDIMPQIWQLQQVHFPLLNKLDIVEDIDNPHSVFFLPQADFYIHMPPGFIGKRRDKI
jgi:hypothetical protein